MQKKILSAIFAALLMLSLGGCGRKNNDRDTSSRNESSNYSSEHRDDNNLGNDVGNGVSDIGEGIGDGVSDIGEGASDLVSDIGEGASDILDPDNNNNNNNNGDRNNTTDHNGTVSDNRNTDDVALNSRQTAAILSDEAIETAATASSLSSEKQGWGQGVQLNDKNQPLASLSFQDKYGEYDAYFIGDDEKVIYLTFDEGYENGYTAQILDTLKEKNVKAVFFVTLDYVKSEPELVQRMIDEGHIIGNHSDKHPSFPEVSAERCEQEIKNVEEYMAENFGYTDMDLFRPPAGEFSEQVLAQMQNLGYKTVFWSYAYKDWDPNNQLGTAKALEKVNGALHNGAIYLLHAVSSDNANILGDFIDHARSEGYEFALFE